MSIPAPSTSQTVTPPHVLGEGYEHDGPETPRSSLRAITDAPENTEAIVEFLCALDRFDPGAPRSDELTAALIAVLSASYEMDGVQRFVESSLTCEIAKVLPSPTDQIHLPDAMVSLITALLHHRCNHSAGLEHFLILLRRTLLESALSSEKPGSDRIKLAEAMARHSFTNEHIWEQTSAETLDVSELLGRVVAGIETGTPVSAFDLFMVAAYQPLETDRTIRNWILELGRADLSSLDPTLRLLVFDRLQEDDIEIETLTAIDDAVSTKVRAQYEENPYPRWRHLPQLFRCDGLSSYLAANLPQESKVPRLDPPCPKVLIAGAGTGRHPIEVAQALPSAAVLAVDLSRASLAYGMREAAARRITNVSFAQADILKLSEAKVEFDLIESVGVLHHMEDPEAGLKALVSVLRTGGFLRLGLYSKIARRGINVARNLNTTAACGAGLAGIRTFRRDLFSSEEPAVASLLKASDFFSTSMFRDAVMHAQEHQFSLQQIDALLRRNGLKFLGFSNASARAALQNMPGKMAKRRNLDLKYWGRYEKSNPETFIGMYQFFCMKR